MIGLDLRRVRLERRMGPRVVVLGEVVVGTVAGDFGATAGLQNNECWKVSCAGWICGWALRVPSTWRASPRKFVS